MKPERKIEVLAKLDGWKDKPRELGGGLYPPNLNPLFNINQQFELPSYLTSYDAIIPLVRKWCRHDIDRWRSFLGSLFGYCFISNNPENQVALALFEQTPQQLSNALIHAAGEWEE